MLAAVEVRGKVDGGFGVRSSAFGVGAPTRGLPETGGLRAIIPAMPTHFLDLLLVVRCGTFAFTQPKLALVVSLSDLRLGQRCESGITVLEPSAPDVFRQSKPDGVAIMRIQSCQEALEFPPRIPDVKARVDTSDSWWEVLLRMRRDARIGELELSLMASGYEGPDAARLEELFDAVLAAAGVSDRCLGHVLAGERRK